MFKPLAGLALIASLASISPSSAREVRVYSGRHYNTDRQVFKTFSEKTGIKVRLIEATGISLVERLKREGSKSKADVILLVDAARINNAAEAGLLRSIQSNQLEKQIPSLYRDPKDRWFGLTRRVRAIIVSPDIVDPAKIKAYADLARPEFAGKLCLRNRKNVYNQSLVADQIILKGESSAKSWVNGMVKNVTQPYFTGDTSLIRASWAREMWYRRCQSLLLGKNAKRRKWKERSNCCRKDQARYAKSSTCQHQCCGRCAIRPEFKRSD